MIMQQSSADQVLSASTDFSSILLPGRSSAAEVIVSYLGIFAFTLTFLGTAYAAPVSTTGAFCRGTLAGYSLQCIFAAPVVYVRLVQ